jgi:hypothetical protein
MRAPSVTGPSPREHLVGRAYCRRERFVGSGSSGEGHEAQGGARASTASSYGSMRSPMALIRLRWDSRQG